MTTDLQQMAGAAAGVDMDPMAGCKVASFSSGKAEIADLRNSASSSTGAALPGVFANGAQNIPRIIPMRYVLTLPYPISANAYWASRTVTPRGGKPFTTTYVTQEAKDYKRQVALLVADAGIREPIKGRVRIDMQLFPNRPLDWQQRMRRDGAVWDDSVKCLDLDNARKVAYDSLKGVVIEDDKWVRQDSGERMEPDAWGARLVLVITALTAYTPQQELLP